ncbi:hypothetical protein SBA4_5480003 [Candidatus Sulfopaludibacter sp. SbA4]|nr:hypothetical protein SBA4_5480003 [Candidatus Sulfopaludibacter sp. SbA4]
MENQHRPTGSRHFNAYTYCNRSANRGFATKVTDPR